MLKLEEKVTTAAGVKKSTSAKDHTEQAIEAADFSAYQIAIIHDWTRTLTVLAFTLVPLFFVLDYFMMPAALLPRFAVYRLTSTLIALAQFFVVRNTRPSRWSFLHGYVTSLQVGATIALMTVSLGGFDSSYYAGLNLVIIGVNLLMPWRATHTAINSAIILLMYVSFNLIAPHAYSVSTLVNNLFFLLATTVIAVSINDVRHRLIRNEFSLLVELKTARDALWSEMELAKRIQTALLPHGEGFRSYEIAVTMLPAREVGGDYYDIIETEWGDRWIAIGDVSGHGVDSGLIMMMAQTSIQTVIKGSPTNNPDRVLNTTNAVIRENIARLGSNHYMSIMLLKLDDDGVKFAGHHQDLLVYRPSQSKVTAIPSKGTWLGITDQISPYTEVGTLDLEDSDLIMLFTDGVTEATNASGEMLGQERLTDLLEANADLPVKKALERILSAVGEFQADQLDDMTLMLIRKLPQSRAS